jgi:hypothetical protein
MRLLRGSSTPVLYTGHMVPKVYKVTLENSIFSKYRFYSNWFLHQKKGGLIYNRTFFPETLKLWSGNCRTWYSEFLYLGKYGIPGAYLNSCLKYLNFLQCILKLIFYNSFYCIWLFSVHSRIFQSCLFNLWTASLFNVQKRTYCSHH